MLFLYEYGLFFAKATTIVLAVVCILLVLANVKGKMSQPKDGKITVSNLNDLFEEMKEEIESAFDLENETVEESKSKESTNDKKWWQFWKKNEKKSKTEIEKNKIFVIDFSGGVSAEEVHDLRHEITAVLQVAKKEDEVFIRLTSPGGVVHGYGLCAAQLDRIKQADIRLTASVDEVAASGGYLMACVADKILASPFAIIGSIGVVAQLPNFHKLLEKHDIDYEQFTAGKYKRTVTMFGENTEEAKAKFKQELDAIHLIFQEFVLKYRPQLKADEVATGEHWLATEAIHKGLVDELMTSDSYLISKHPTHHILQVRYEKKENINQKLSKLFGQLLAKFTHLN